jgi:hypothetical protein
MDSLVTEAAVRLLDLTDSGAAMAHTYPRHVSFEGLDHLKLVLSLLPLS